jgi:ABC-type sugar transport system permease subunit
MTAASIAAPRSALGEAMARARGNAIFYFLVAPFALTTALFGVWPIAESIRVAFTENYTALSPDPTYVGLANFASVLATPAFHNALWRTLLYTGVAVPVNVLTALALALLLSHRSIRVGRTLYKLALFLPVVCPEVAGYIVLKTMFNQDFGAVNRILLLLGLPGFPGLTTPGSAFVTLLAIETWNHVGLYTILFLTNIQLLDRGLEEAAAIDGAGRWRMLVHVIVPQLRPAIVVNALYALIEFLKTFSVVYVVSRGGPNFSTDFVSYYAWTRFGTAQYGEATAVATIIFVLVCALSGLAYAWLGRDASR